mmetsp:Transcript_18936/g.52160  ORF Transcript_18936/g.52160 Transcript_18936/m.52160 type:complete len:260 (+) Transcript_18936:1349-2128(+)
MHASIVGIGNFSPKTKPRSSSFASNAATHIATRSPCMASGTATLNICKLRTFLFLPASPSCGTTMPCCGLTLPDNTVPVRTVPWPLIGKAWSKENMNGPVLSRFGITIFDFNSSMRSLTPMAGEPSCGLAATQAKGKSAPNFVRPNVARNCLMIEFKVFCRFASGIMSTLFKMMINWFARISATTRHSAVWACMPLFASTTSVHKSMICAPPMTVRISDACPGQSTRQNCNVSKPSSLKCSGASVENDEKPRSRVIPRS